VDIKPVTSELYFLSNGMKQEPKLTKHKAAYHKVV